MANEQNLIMDRSPSEVREMGRKGGIASGKARRERKTLREELLALLSVKVTCEDGKKHTMQERMSEAILRRAVDGDVKAFQAVRDTIGEMPESTVHIDTPKAAMLDDIRAELTTLQKEVGAE